MFYLFFSCTNKVEKKIVIKDFSKSFFDSVQPNKKMIKEGYVVYNVEIKGNVNDTIIVYFVNNKNFPTYLTGEINERYWEEYTGKLKKHLRIEPYKATKGILKIRYGLYK